MTTVRNFYKKDCKNATPECRCTPAVFDEVDIPECSFATDELITDFDTKMNILSQYGYELPVSNGLDNNSEEALDFIREYPIYIVKAGKVLCHSTSKSAILSFSKEKETFLYSPKLGWWNEFFAGHANYKGGWFTYETNYGGPMFGILLYYRVTRDIPVLFVPNYKALKDDLEYFSSEDVLDHQYTGSHIVRGVKGWKQKNYPKITPKYYADEFAQRLIDLGFPGYISCDECEVFVSHISMQKSLYDRPFRIIYVKCSKCSEKNLLESEKCHNCGENLSTQPAREEVQTIFHMMVDALCEAKSASERDKCPLKINEGNRNTIDLQIVPLTKEIMKKVLPTEEFLREYGKVQYLS